MKFNPQTITAENGYVGRSIMAAMGGGRAIYPSRNVLYTRKRELEVFSGCSNVKTDIGGPDLHLFGNTWATTNGGNIIQHVGESAWLVGGTGPVKTPDPTTPATVDTIATMSTILQIVLLINGVYQAAVQAGLSEPSSPALGVRTSLGAGFVGKNIGTYAAEVTKRRTGTGSESLPSEPSNTVTAQNQSLRVEMPPQPVDGTDVWRVYFTPHGLAFAGPFLLYIEVLETELTDTGTGTINIGVDANLWTRVSGRMLKASDVDKQIVIAGAGGGATTLTTTIDAVDVGLQTATLHDAAGTSVVAHATTFNAFVDGVARAIEIEFEDDQLSAEEPPTDNFPPPSADFVFQLGNVMCLVAGLALYVSVPGQPEAYPPSFVSFLPEIIINVLGGRPQSGFAYLLCGNSVSAAMYSGAIDGAPVIVRPVWNNIGCAGLNAACVVGDTLYMVTKAGRLVRTDDNGTPDYAFAADIETEIAGLDPAGFVLSYDDVRHVVSLCSGQKIWCFHVDLGIWSPPIDLSQVTGAGQPTGPVKSAITLDSKMRLLTFEGGKYNQYKFDDGNTGTSSAIIAVGWNALGDGDLVTIRHLVVSFDSGTSVTVTGGVYKDMDVSTLLTPQFTLNLNSTKKLSDWVNTNIVAGKFQAFSFALNGAGQKFNFVRAEGLATQARGR